MKSRKDFHGIVLSLEKMVRDGGQLIKGGSVKLTIKQLQLRIGIKPRLVDCLEGLSLLHEMHQSEYELFSSLFPDNFYFFIGNPAIFSVFCH